MFSMRAKLTDIDGQSISSTPLFLFQLTASFHVCCLLAASIRLSDDQIFCERLARDYTCNYNTLILNLDFV